MGDEFSMLDIALAPLLWRLNFLLLAFVIFCMLKALSSMRRKLELEAEKATPPTPENIVLLREILAELKKK